MDSHSLEKSIQGVRNRPLPKCPASVEANVLRRVRLARSAAPDSLLSLVTTLLPRPAFLATALALGIALSAAVTSLTSSAHTASLERRQLASSALDFDVFASPNYLPLPDRERP